MGEIVVYSIVGCPHCLAAKKRLKDEGLDYLDVSVDRFPQHVKEWLTNKTGKTSVPQIFFNSRHIGGNKELQELLDSPEKEEALALLKAGPKDGEELPLVPHPSEALEKPTSSYNITCEKDELAEIASKIAESDLLQSHKIGLFSSASNSFTGESLISYLRAEGTPHPEAVAQALLEARLIASLKKEEEAKVRDAGLYTLSHLLRPQGLNSGVLAECKVKDADVTAMELRTLVLKLFADFLSPDGKRVDYQGMAASDTWPQFTRVATQLQRVNLKDISADHKLAFFINVYNVLVIHGTVVKGVPNGLYQRYKFFSNTAYNIGGLLFSLNDIENGILRANRSSMATLYRTPFSPSDPRLALALATAEPRIHFALNCGAKSCPPIKTFSGNEVQEQLNLATQSFLEGDDALVVDTAKKQVWLSQLFQWYAVDFGANKEEVLAWILLHLKEPVKKKQLEELVKEGGVKVSYLHYDWGHNGKE